MADTSTKPPRFFFDRKTLGIMETALDVLDGMTIGGVSSAAFSAFMSDKWLSAVLSIGTFVLQLTKLGLRSLISKSLPTNPINTTEQTTVSQAEPIQPLTPIANDPVSNPTT